MFRPIVNDILKEIHFKDKKTMRRRTHLAGEELESISISTNALDSLCAEILRH